MPVLTRRKMVQVAYGIRCDRCCLVDENHFNDFTLNHTLGYASVSDMTSVQAALCDDCLVEIILTAVPAAVFTDPCGTVLTQEEKAELLERATAKREARAGSA